MTSPFNKENLLVLRYVAGDIIVAAFFSMFVVVNTEQFYAMGDISYIIVAANQGVYVALYLVRERAVVTSTSIIDWAVALSATFLATLLMPGSPVNVSFGNALIITGTLVNIASVLYLNRSISIVPAERSIKTGGLYRFVRHPMYSSAMLIIFGYLFVNFSPANVLIVICDAVLFFIRIEREERFLSRSGVYKEYTAKTPWKLLPFIY